MRREEVGFWEKKEGVLGRRRRGSWGAAGFSPGRLAYTIMWRFVSAAAPLSRCDDSPQTPTMVNAAPQGPQTSHKGRMITPWTEEDEDQEEEVEDPPSNHKGSF